MMRAFYTVTVLAVILCETIFIAQLEARTMTGPKCDRIGQYLAHETYCRKFYQCGHSRFEKTCPHGTIWDQRLLACNHPQAVADPTPTDCPDRDGSAPATNTATVRSTATLTEVSTGSPSSAVPIGSASATTASGRASSKNEFATPAVSPFLFENGAAKCEYTGQYLPHERFCRMFYQCGHSRFEKSCPTGTIWDQRLLTCNFPRAVDRPTPVNCPDRDGRPLRNNSGTVVTNDPRIDTSTLNAHRPTVFLATEAETAATKKPLTDKSLSLSTISATPVSESRAPECERIGQYLPHERFCQKFYQCGNSRFEKVCPRGTIWDQSILTCNYPSAVLSPTPGDCPDRNGENSTQATSDRYISTLSPMNMSTTYQSSPIAFTSPPVSREGTTVVSESSSTSPDSSGLAHSNSSDCSKNSSRTPSSSSTSPAPTFTLSISSSIASKGSTEAPQGSSVSTNTRPSSPQSVSTISVSSSAVPSVSSTARDRLSTTIEVSSARPSVATTAPSCTCPTSGNSSSPTSRDSPVTTESTPSITPSSSGAPGNSTLTTTSSSASSSIPAASESAADSRSPTASSEILPTSFPISYTAPTGSSTDSLGSSDIPTTVKGSPQYTEATTVTSESSTISDHSTPHSVNADASATTPNDSSLTPANSIANSYANSEDTAIPPLCTKDGQYKPHEQYCTRFYHCANAGRFEKRCPLGTIWDQSILTCNYVWSVQNPAPANCPDRAGDAMTETTTVRNSPLGSPVSPATGRPVVNSTRASSASKNCQYVGQYLPHEIFCTKFYHCGSSRFEKTCASGTIWDQAMQICNYRWSVARPMPVGCPDL